MERWGDVFSPRQALAMTTLARLVREAVTHFSEQIPKSPGSTGDLAEALATCLGIVVGRQGDMQSSLVTWTAGGEFVGHTFVRQALGMVWDFAEPVPWVSASGNWAGAIDWVSRVIEHESSDGAQVGHVESASATAHPLPDDAAAAFRHRSALLRRRTLCFTSLISLFWMRRTLADVHPNLFHDEGVPKEAEIVVDRPHRLSRSTKDIVFYERELTHAFAEAGGFFRQRA